MSSSKYSIWSPAHPVTHHLEPAEMLPEDHAPDMVDALIDAFRTGDYGPITVRCGGREWSVLRVIMFTKSPVFDRMMNSDFKEGSARIIELPDDDPVAVHSMIIYMYTNMYPQCVSTTTSFEVALHETKVYALGEKYILNAMKSIAYTRFCAAIFSKNTSLFATLSPNEALSLVDYVYTSTPDHDLLLRNAIVDAIRGLAFSQPLLTYANLSCILDVYDFCVDVAITVNELPPRNPTSNDLRPRRTGFEVEIAHYLRGSDVQDYQNVYGGRSRVLCQGRERFAEIQDAVQERWDEGYSEHDIVRHWFTRYYELVGDLKPVVANRAE